MIKVNPVSLRKLVLFIFWTLTRKISGTLLCSSVWSEVFVKHYIKYVFILDLKYSCRCNVSMWFLSVVHLRGH